MSRHDDRVRLRHMLDHASEAVSLLKGKTKSQLKRTRLLQLGLMRLVEVIGEAASRISREIRVGHPEIPWEDAVGMRHKLIHDYITVDLDILWDTVKDDLPPLIEALERILAEEDKS
ncbi:MAG TPA: DUF86 domain-containing protein [Candidatus Binatia bacterium]